MNAIMHPSSRTGVRFVLANPSDASRLDELSDWYDSYSAAITVPGYLANDIHFENPDAGDEPSSPRYATIYDIVSPVPAAAWPDTEHSPAYPTHLFYSAARFRLIEGSPEPAEWLEVFETDDPDPLRSYPRATCDVPSAPRIRPQLSRSFRLASPRRTNGAWSRHASAAGPARNRASAAASQWQGGCAGIN